VTPIKDNAPKLMAAAALLMMTACAATQRAPMAQVMATPPSGMLTDMGQLTPGGPGQVSLRYINPSVSWSSYTKIIIQPVTFWGDATSAPSTDTQQMLSDYLYNELNRQLGRDYQIVTQPGPNTMVLKIALTDASGSTPGLRTISVVVPQARLLTALGNVVTGNQAFAGEAQGEGEVTDSLTGERLAAFVDRRQASSKITNATSWRWGDVKTVMDNWVGRIQTQLTNLRQTT
jgi:hypothetical protein